MTRRTKSLLLAFLLVSGLSSVSAGARRRLLDAPEIVKFDPRADYSPAYLEATLRLQAEARERGLDEVGRRVDALRETLVRERLLAAAAGIIGLLREQGIDRDSDDSLWGAAEGVDELIRSWSYLHPTSHPLDVTVDQERRVYRLRWNEGGCDGWCGDRFGGVEIPFPPSMELSVAASFDPTKGGRYGYAIDNRPASAASILSTIWLESRFFTEERLERVDRVPFPEQKFTLEDGWLWLMYPKWGGHFRLAVFDRKDLLFRIPPGSAFEIPTVVSLPFEALPAVLSCWIEIDGYQATREVHEEPENALRAFSRFKKVEVAPGRTVSVPRFAYHGKTIGPTPAPGPGFTLGQFVGRLLDDLETGREWGWMEAADEAWFREQLRALESDGDRTRLDRILQRAEASFRDGNLLVEARTLLEVNLRYLAGRYLD